MAQCVYKFADGKTCNRMTRRCKDCGNVSRTETSSSNQGFDGYRCLKCRFQNTSGTYGSARARARSIDSWQPRYKLPLKIPTTP